jgi:hypothetical protein
VFTVQLPNNVFGRDLFYGMTREEAIANAQSFIAQPSRNPVPDNPFRGNWYKPVINNFLVKAAKEGKGGIGFPTGSIVSSRYGLSQIVDEINVVGRTDAVTGEKSRSVGIDTVDGQRIQFGVDNNGKIDNVNSQDYVRLVGKGLDEVIGKGFAKKIMEGGPQTISGEGLKIGGEGKDKLYDDMLPKHLNEIGKRYGVQLEKRTIPFGESGKKESEVYFMPITEEMRNDILSQGLPMFKQGGSVKKFAPGGKVLKGISKGAREAAKEGQKMLQGVYRGYTGERLEEPILSTTPQRKVAEYYATRRAATRGEDPHVEMLMVDPFVGKEYGLALPIDEFNRELLTTRARAIAPSDVVERTQLKKKGGLACLSK